MQMRVSEVENLEEESVALPESIRERLGLRAGDLLDVSFEAERVVLRRQESVKKYELKMITDPVTGLPVLTAGPGAPELTSEMVAEMLKDFP